MEVKEIKTVQDTLKHLKKKLSKEDIELAKKLHNTFTPEEFERELDQIKDGGPS